jgi:squalene-hopene/tetraprenyl-beta-curcumene cyclase
MPLDFTEEGKSVKRAVVDLERRWPSGVALQYDTLQSHIRIYDFYPFLFHRAFPSVPEEAVRKLALAGRLFFSSLLLFDRLMDRTSPAHLATEDGLRIQALRFEADLVLHELFPADSPFWNHFQGLISAYAAACLEEQSFATGARPWQEYDEATALRIAVGKNGVARAAVAGLCALAGDMDLMPRLTESIDGFNVAFQMLDDLKDCREDLRARIPSLLLSRVVGNWAETKAEERWIEGCIREVYYQGHARYVLDLALESLQRAKSIVADLPLLEWQSVISDLEARCRDFLPDMEQILMRNRSRARERPPFELHLPPAENPWQGVAWDALRFVVRQWKLGFGEARHLLRFKKEEALGLAAQLQHGDTFQRALIADVLCDADEVLDGRLRPVIDQECEYLLSQRSTTGIGGWSYFPNMPELAPDADDLAQVMQVLLRAERSADVRKYCERPLQVLLEENAHPDGAFETWIIPAATRTPGQEIQDQYARLAWGTGADTEVVANLLYALSLYDPDRFQETIDRGVSFLESRQHPEGYWQSSWYHGPFYGTYVCLRLLARVRPASPALAQGLRFLRAGQCPDGGWKMEGQSDGLSTALALLGLAAAPAPGDPEDTLLVSRALRFLESDREQDLDREGWPVYQFIRMVLGRPTGTVRHVLSHGSQTLTTAYVLKAALLWHRRSQSFRQNPVATCA